MSRSIISEGKTTNEAIENGLKQLKVSKNMVDIKVLENEDKKSFFSILAPRVVKVELILKENVKEIAKEKSFEKNEQRKFNTNSEEIKDAENAIKNFLDVFIQNLPTKDVTYTLEIKEYCIYIDFQGSDINYLIGYRGDVLNSVQNIISSIANKKSTEKIKVFVDMQGYREKRRKSLEELAVKISKTVIKTGKSITLEPMTSYERKIIHSKLQENDKVKTFSKGEDPYRKVVISLK